MYDRMKRYIQYIVYTVRIVYTDIYCIDVVCRDMKTKWKGGCRLRKKRKRKRNKGGWLL